MNAPHEPLHLGRGPRRVLIAGMTPQTASAVELIVRAVFGAVAIVRHDRGPALAPAAVAAQARPDDLCVVDLLGFGWARWSVALEQALRQELFGPRPAIVLLPPGGSDWAARLADHATEHSGPVTPGAGQPLRLMLVHPASMTAMRGALQRLCDALPAGHGPGTQRDAPAPDPAAARPLLAGLAGRVGLGALGGRVRALVQPPAPVISPAASPAPVPLPAPAALAWPDTQPPAPDTQAPRRAPARGDAGRSAPAPAAAPPAAVPVPRAVQPFRLDPDARAAVAAACPAVAANPFLSLVLGVVSHATPHAFHIGRQTGAIFHPAHNWVASNIATALRKRLTQHRLMLEIAQVQALDEDQARIQAQLLYGRRSDGRRTLDGFVWALVYNTFEDDLPVVDGSLGLQLRRLPNFTRLPEVPDAFVQMALLCLQGPQNVAGLRRAYPGVHPGQVGLFVLCALLSGLATALPARAVAAPAPAHRPAMPATPAPAAAPVRTAAPPRSFIRSLLAKLF